MKYIQTDMIKNLNNTVREKIGDLTNVKARSETLNEIAQKRGGKETM